MEDNTAIQRRRGDRHRNIDRPAHQRQRDEYLRPAAAQEAEFDNYRKRVERERQTLSEAAAAEHASKNCSRSWTISSAR